MKYLLIACLALTSCTRTVYVATKCPAPNIPPEPHYAVYDLQKDDPMNKVMHAYVISLHHCIGENKLLRKKLEGYKHE